MANLYFRASEDALNNITSAFNFSHPLRASLRYTRSILHQLIASSDHINSDLCEKTINSDLYVSGINYKDAFFDTSFEQQEEKIAWVLLNHLLAIHEGWVDRIFTDFFDGNGYTRFTFEKKLESTGLQKEFASYFTPKSKESAITIGFYDAYYKKAKTFFHNLDNYMRCYRYFKESRNCYMHKNFLVSRRLLDSYNEYLPVANTIALATKESPEIIAPTLGQPARLSMRGVIGFSEIIMRIIIISDAYLLKNKCAEKEIIERRPYSWNCQLFSSNSTKMKGQITQYCNKAGLLKPDFSDELHDYLIMNSIFK